MFIRSRNLQDICLTAIIRDIDLFVKDKTVHQNHIDFLFREYSDEIYAAHKALKISIDEDRMLWLLNPNVKKVILPDKLHSKRVIEQLKMIGSNIIFLSLRNSKAIADELNSIISSMPHLIHLDLSFTACNNETLKCICKSCPDLESLNVSWCNNITTSGLKHLSSGKLKLKSLNLDVVTKLHPSGVVRILKRIPTLECFKYDKLDNLLPQIGYKKYNLTELVYYGDIFNDNDAGVIHVWTKICPKLKKLHFTSPVEKDVLETCTYFQNLEELKIKMSHEACDVIRFYDVLNPILPISRNLKTLILSCVTISLITLIERFENLENLYLKKVSFTPFQIDNVKVSKTNLSTLVIKNVNMNIHDTTYEAIALLISLSKDVTKLQLSHIKGLPSELFDVILSSMKSLISVNFKSTPIEVNQLNQLFDIPSLNKIISEDFYVDDNNSVTDVKVSKYSSCTFSWRSNLDFNDDNWSDIDDDVIHEDNQSDDNVHEGNQSSDDESGHNEGSIFHGLTPDNVISLLTVMYPLMHDCDESDTISDECHSFDSDFDYDEWYDP